MRKVECKEMNAKNVKIAPQAKKFSFQEPRYSRLAQDQDDFLVKDNKKI